MNVTRPNSFRTGPDDHGHFGLYGGRFVAETLMPLILQLEQAYLAAKADPQVTITVLNTLGNLLEGRQHPLLVVSERAARRRRGRCAHCG